MSASDVDDDIIDISEPTSAEAQPPSPLVMPPRTPAAPPPPHESTVATGIENPCGGGEAPADMSDWPDSVYVRVLKWLKKSLSTRRLAHIKNLRERWEQEKKSNGGGAAGEFNLGDHVKMDDFEALYDVGQQLPVPRLRALVDQVWQRRSALSGRPVTTETLRLCKWNPLLPASPANIVVMYEDEPMAHNKLIHARNEQPPYSADVMQYVASNAALIDQQRMPPLERLRTYRSPQELGILSRKWPAATSAAIPKKRRAAELQRRDKSDDEEDPPLGARSGDEGDTGSDLEDFIVKTSPTATAAEAASSDDDSGDDDDDEEDSGVQHLV